MELQPESMERRIAASLKATYRALLARGLEAGEAANLTAFLHGLPSAGFRWTLPEIEAIVRRRLAHAAERPRAPHPRRHPTTHRGSSTHPRPPAVAFRHHARHRSAEVLTPQLLNSSSERGTPPLRSRYRNGARPPPGAVFDSPGRRRLTPGTITAPWVSGR